MSFQASIELRALALNRRNYIIDFLYSLMISICVIQSYDCQLPFACYREEI